MLAERALLGEEEICKRLIDDGNGRRAFVIGKPPQRVLKNNFAAGHHSENAARECARSDRVCQHAVHSGKLPLWIPGRDVGWDDFGLHRCIAS